MARKPGGKSGEKSGEPAQGSPLVLVGRFGAPHGVRGEIRVKSFTADPMALAGYTGLTDSAGVRDFTFRRARPVKDDMLIAQVLGIDDRNAAESIVNIDIFLPRAALPPPDEDEFYITDLIGLEARLPDGNLAGQIRSVENFGAGDILVIVSADGGEMLVPFTRRAVPHVELTSRLVTIDPPAEVIGEEEPPASGPTA